MKIAMMITSLDAGGAERVITSLANHWSTEGHQIYLFTFSDKIFYSLSNDVKLQMFNLEARKGRIRKSIYIIKILYLLRKEFKKNKIQCIVSFTNSINIFSVLLHKLFRTPVIISERCDPYTATTSYIITLFRKKIYRYANAIVLQTQASINSFKKAKIKLPVNKTIIFNPIPGEFKNLSKARKNVILSVGRLSVEKGHDLLIEAFKNTNIPDWELWIIGVGPLLPVLKEKAIKLGIHKKVKFLGRKRNILDYYNSALIFVLPSRSEGFPNALCEAMACGCGVISFDCPNGPSEIIRNGENGLLVENGNILALSKAILCLTNDEDFLTNLSKEATKIVDQLNIGKISKQWLQLVRKVSEIANESFLNTGS